MKRLLLTCLVAAMMLALSAQAQAVTLNLSSSTDTNNLTVGDTFTVDVSLADLDEGSGEQLTSLTGSVLFPSALLGTPSSIDAGPINQDPTDFLPLALPGLADGVFIELFGGPIFQNGVFYSFTVTALAAGSGQFELDPIALIAEDPSLNLVDVDAGDPLPFTISDPVSQSPIPEPATAMLALMGGAALLVGRRRQTAA